MLTRDLFVTNSSSTSHVVYGIRLNEEQILKLLEKLVVANQELVKEECEKEFSWSETASLVTRFRDLSEWWELATMFLPSGLAIFHDESSSKTILKVLGHLSPTVEEGKVILTGVDVKAVIAALDLAKEIGVDDSRYPPIKLHHWCNYDG